MTRLTCDNFFPELNHVFFFFYHEVVLHHEEDVVAYTMTTATKPYHYLQPPENNVSQLDLICYGEKKTGQTLKRIHIPEEDLVKLSDSKTSLFQTQLVCAYLIQYFTV